MKSRNLPDDLCENYAEKGVKITLKALSDDENIVLIESDKEGLLFLSELLKAQANSKDDGFMIMPNGPGKKLFTRSSKLGLYIHRKD